MTVSSQQPPQEMWRLLVLSLQWYWSFIEDGPYCHSSLPQKNWKPSRCAPDELVDPKNHRRSPWFGWKHNDIQQENVLEMSKHSSESWCGSGIAFIFASFGVMRLGQDIIHFPILAWYFYPYQSPWLPALAASSRAGFQPLDQVRRGSHWVWFIIGFSAWFWIKLFIYWAQNSNSIIKLTGINDWKIKTSTEKLGQGVKGGWWFCEGFPDSF